MMEEQMFMKNYKSGRPSVVIDDLIQLIDEFFKKIQHVALDEIAYFVFS